MIIKLGSMVTITDISQDGTAYTDTEGEYEEYSDEWWQYIGRLKLLIGEKGEVTNVVDGYFVEVTIDGEPHYFQEYDLKEIE